ncbi:MAG TPA: divalent metal cation transporter [Anaerolineales bacterium]|nr:divalent metal cation transporter [Anaerolineales bacterium]
MRSTSYRIRPIWSRLAFALAIIGPGIITANVDNDAGGISTYSVAGARYGLGVLWILPLLAVALILVQEMSSRLGIVTGKGLGDLIRESLGVRVTALILGLLLVANWANTVSEFAGVAAASGIFGVSKFLAVPLAGALVWLLVVRGNYRSVERIFLVASAVYLAYVGSGILARPDWTAVARAAVSPRLAWDSGYLVMLVTIIGTTIAPWMQFYQQAAIVDKGLRPAELGWERLDVVVGSLFAIVVAGFIVIACASTLFVHGQAIETAEDAAVALRPLAGSYASTLFAVGLLNASLFAAAILPLSTAYVVCEAFGWEVGVSRTLRQAPTFFGIYTALIVLGAGVVLLPLQSLVRTMIASQTLNGILLPVILVVMLRLINDRRLMGTHVNGRILNVLTWAIVATLVILTAALVVITVFPGSSH